MKNTYIRVLSTFLIIIFLTGCFYPNNELSKNQVPNEAQLEQIQSAVDTYQKETNGLVPIKTKSSETPVFQKYLIDFSMLKERNNIAEIPGNAFENGGIYQYVLITPEENPRVKLIDLRITEAIRDVSVKLEIYRSEHIYPPYGEEIADGVFEVDYKKLNLEEYPYVKSPYSKNNLPIIMNTQGKLYVDYRIDLMNALKEHEHDFKSGEDIRYILANNNPFVPAYSLPYTIHEGEPVFNITKK